MVEPPGPLVGCITALGRAWERSIQVTEKYKPGTFSEEIARKPGTNSNDTPPCNKLKKVCTVVLSRVLLMAYSSILLEYVLDSTYS